MYQKVDPSGTAPESFEFPHGGKLASDNRWVMMAQLIPWSEFEAEYAQNFAASMGPPTKSFRMALGALIIKEKLGTSDRETVEQIRENPYLQYFIGFSSYSNEIPFDASLLVHFRKRISFNLINKVNQQMVKKIREATTPPAKANKKEAEEPGERCNPWKITIRCDLCQRGHYLSNRHRNSRSDKNANRKNPIYPLRVNQRPMPEKTQKLTQKSS